MSRVAELTAERDEIDRKREMAEYTCIKYAEDLRVARSEALELQKSMVSFSSKMRPRTDSLQDCDSFVMVLVDGDGMPVSAPLRVSGLLAATHEPRPDSQIVPGRPHSTGGERW